MKRLSRFVHVLERPDTPHFALYHAGKIKTVFLENQELETIKRWKQGIPEEELPKAQILAEQGMVIEEGDDERAIADIQSSLDPYLMAAYLILTDVCNLGCKYCFIEGNFPENYQTSTMTWEIAKKGMDIFRKQARRDGLLDVWFYGGEPLVNKDLLFACADYLNEVEDPSKLTLTIITNGTLITPEVAKRLAGYPNLAMSVSVDGPATVHDANRVFKSGGGSFAAVERGIRNLQECGIPFGISCTVPVEQADHVAENVAWLSDHFGISAVNINFLTDTPRGLVSEEYIHRANQSLINCFKTNRDSDLTEDRFLRKARAFISSTPRWRDCAACGCQFVVAPDGRIGVCHEGLGERRTFVSHVDDPEFDFQTNPTIRQWAKRSPISMPECYDCIALATCGGGCPYASLLRTGSIWNLDRRFCVHSKETLEWLIWDLYEQTVANN